MTEKIETLLKKLVSKQSRLSQEDAADYVLLIKSFPLFPFESEKVYELALEVSNILLDHYDELSVGAKVYFEELSNLIGRYEERWKEEENVSPRQLLKFLMGQNDLRQVDLTKEFGSASRVSEYLAGNRELSLTQIRRLADRFSLSPAAFIESTLESKPKKSPAKVMAVTIPKGKKATVAGRRKATTS